MSYFVIENLGTGKICSIIDNQCGKWGYDIRNAMTYKTKKKALSEINFREWFNKGDIYQIIEIKPRKCLYCKKSRKGGKVCQ